MNCRAISIIPMILVSLLLGGALSRLQAQQNKQSLQPCLEHKKRVEAELSQQQKQPWVGEYERSFQSFLLAPQSGFFLFRGSDYRYWSCAWGQVEVSKSRIKLIPDESVPVEGTRGVALSWTIVDWGKRQYLIPTDDLLDFANSVNNGYEPSYRFPGLGGSFFKKKGDEDLRVTGFPNVPESYRRYLLTNPIRGSVTSLGNSTVEKIDGGKTDVRTTTLTLNVGSKHGVLVGMRFITYKPRLVHEDIVVTKVFENSSEAVVRQEGSYHDAPSTKWKISTSIRDIR